MLLHLILSWIMYDNLRFEFNCYSNALYTASDVVITTRTSDMRHCTMAVPLP
jgi:hypothetical protein